MKHWTPRLSGQNHDTNKNHAVKLSQLKLQIGLFGGKVVASATNDKVAVQITGTNSSANKNGKMKSILVPFHGTQKRGRCSTHTTSTRRFLTAKAPSIAWDARDLSGFNLPLKHNTSPVSLEIAFHVLYGEGAAGESKSSNKEKMAVVGRVSMSVSTAELLPKEEKMAAMKRGSSSQHRHHHQLQRKLPIKLRVNGLSIEATLSVSMRLMKVMNSNDDLAKPIENTVESKKRLGIIERVKYLTSLKKEKEKKINNVNDELGQPSPYESDGSPVFDSDDSFSNVSTTSSGSGSSSSSSRILHHNAAGSDSGYRMKNMSERLERSEKETILDRGNRSWSQIGERGFKTNTTKQESLTTHSNPSTKSRGHSLQSHFQDNDFGSSRWKFKEISSRDGQAKLKTNVFFASFDQRSEQASGESACSVLVALIAHWLHCNKSDMPTRSQFDRLITQGSYEWRKLCNNDYYLKLFPDKHFDLETIIDANLRPVSLVPQESYTGFFSPEKFHCLKGAMSFDEIWDEINKKVVVDHEPRIYIVSWNDHFFVLKVEADAYYVIDSLGERLFEGCKQGFILKFDEFSVMHSVGGTNKGGKSDHDHEIVCRGKDCCKEFIKRFLAAIPLWQLEKEEKKGNVSSLFLHRQLQIEFHYSNSTSKLH